MSRLPFNPDRVPAPASASKDQWTVSQLAQRLRDVLVQGLPRKIRVTGEISNFSARSHWYFSLKDEKATVRCVCFASAARRVQCDVADGMRVVITGHIDYYEQQGQVQLYVDRIEPLGVGDLELRFRALCNELRDLGYFDPAKKKPLPPIPRCVAVVTSRSSAALQDVINTAAKRWRGCRLVLVDVLVQGEAAAPQIAHAIDQLSLQGRDLCIDAIILTRGGGSIEDLWAFNEKVVAEAIHHCQIPIVAAIGHETDTTIAELVADVRCSTPTQAAMQVIPDRGALEHQVEQLERRLKLLVGRQLATARQRIDALARHRLLRRPEHMIDPQQRRLELARNRLAAVLPRQLQSQQQKLQALARQLQAVGPQNVLSRGYSYTLGPDGSVLREAAKVADGQWITTVLSQGQLRSRVGDPANAAAAGEVNPPTPAALNTNAGQRRRRRDAEPGGPGLFD